jgi:hypothetical protein
MGKIDPDFQYDAFLFVIEGIRNELMERWYGDPEGINPENSIQGWFERIHARILQLPLLLDPDFEDTNLDLLLGQVGWDSSEEVDFTSGLSDAVKRRLVALSVPFWKTRGTDQGITNFLRILTGQVVLIRSWFYHRMILDEAGFWFEGGGADPWLTGSRYTEGDESLTWLIVNRGNIDELDRELVYNVLTFTRAAGDHFGVVYAAFADDFSLAPVVVPEKVIEPDLLPQWTQTGLGVDIGDNNVELSAGSSILTRVEPEIAATWGPAQHVLAQVSFETTSGDSLIFFGMMNEAETTFYRVELVADGTLRIGRSGATVVVATTVTMPEINTPMTLEMLVEPQDAATNRVIAKVGGLEFLSFDFVGSLAYDDPAGGVRLAASGGEPVTVDEVIVLASPNQLQYVGQKAITPTPGVGGNPQYIADPDPGIEEFSG